MPHIPYGRQDITDSDIRAVVEVLQSDWLTQGPAVDRFEHAIAGLCGVPHALAVNSATSALHLACRALGLTAGDRLWTSPNTFVASANCALYCGASVDFVDIDPQTYNLCARALARKLEQAARDGQLPKVVVPVHFAGQSCDMAEIHGLGQQYGFRIIEDASHAIGGSYRGSPIGSCEYSDIAVFSFHPVKIITTGEGGMTLTRDPALDARMRLLRSHGITRDIASMTVPSHGPWYYQQQELGYNYRMTDLQAALGYSQLQRLGDMVNRRRELADRYDGALRGLPLQLPTRRPDRDSAWHLYVVRLTAAEAAAARLKVMQALRQAGVLANVHYIPVHTQPYYQAMGFRPGDYPESENYYDAALSLPLYSKLSEADQDYVIDVLSRAISTA